MAEKPQHIGTIFAEDVDCATQAADFSVDMLIPGTDAMLNRVETELNLFNVAADSRRFNPDPIF